MKTIILLLSLVLSASAATLYPVMTDNSGRTFTGGATNLALLSGTNVFSGTNTFNTNTILGTAKLQDTLDSKPTVALTNVARLDQSQTFTQTNTFSTNTILGTNRVGDFLGEGARWRRLYIGGPFTNEPASSTPATNLIATITLPPLMSPNSQVFYSTVAYKTNVTAQPVWTLEFWANGTNGSLLHGANVLASANYMNNSVTSVGGTLGSILFRNLQSYSVQRPAGTNYTTASPSYLLGWDTTAATNTIYVQLINSSATGTAPINIEFLELLERY